jgi:AcrR family transcriptional regulator
MSRPATDSLGPPPETSSTRERILDVALDLFTEKGFDRASLREVAEKLGITKAALYYHFASKDDILMALHMRLHELGKEALSGMLQGDPVTLNKWAALLDEVMSQMLTHRKIFLMHERNQAALEKLHRTDHDAEHEDLQTRFRRVLSDPRVPVRDRVRMAASFGAVFAGLFMAGDAFDSVPSEEMGQLIREAVRDLLGVTTPPPGRPRLAKPGR